MSHHLDTPLAGQNGQLYIDDLYVFPADGSTLFVMDVNSTITGPDVQRGFHPEARYEFKVHFDGADFEDLTYRVSFGAADSDGRQGLRLHALIGGQAREDSAAGHLVLQGRTGEPASEGDTRIWAGRIADSFYIDLSLLGIINAAVRNGTAADLSAWRPENAKNSFANTRHPCEDFNADGEYIAEQIAAVVSASGTSDDPQGYAQAVARELFPDLLPYVVGVAVVSSAKTTIPLILVGDGSRG